MHGHSERPSFVLLLLLIGICSGCSADVTDDSSSMADSIKDAKLSPLDKYLGEGAVSFESGMTVELGGDTDPFGPQSQTNLERKRVHQKFVAECMRDAGFEYVEFVPSEGDFPREVSEAHSLSDEEFAVQYGYGISTIDATQEAFEDPNTKIVEAMSQRERSEYNEALYGVDIDAPDGERSGSEAGVGCYELAVRKANAELDVPGEGDVKLLMDELSALQFRIEFDPRVVEAERRWVECMHDAGVTEVESIGDGSVAVINMWNEAANSVEGEEMQDPAPDSVAMIQKFEIEVATADYACREEFFDETFEAVVTEREQQFVEEHRELLSVFSEAFGSGD